MNDITLSIIIPIYNPDLNHFDHCVNSIYSQLTEGIEVIFVDDASPSKEYGAILQKLTDEHTKLLHNSKNLGQGLSRQRGLDEAKGQFVTFVDQDDELAEAILPYMVERLRSSGCTLLMRTNKLFLLDYDKPIRVEYNDVDFLHGLYFNKEGLKKYGVRFHPELKASEDTYFLSLISAIVFECEDVWQYQEEDIVTYKWYIWSNSTSHTDVDGVSYFERTFDTFTRCQKESIEWAIERYHDPEFYVGRLYYIIMNIYMYSIVYSKSKIKTKLLKLSFEFINWALSVLELSMDELYDVLYANDDIYKACWLDINQRYAANIIPEQTLKDFLMEAKNYDVK